MTPEPLVSVWVSADPEEPRELLLGKELLRPDEGGSPDRARITVRCEACQTVTDLDGQAEFSSAIDEMRELLAFFRMRFEARCPGCGAELRAGPTVTLTEDRRHDTRTLSLSNPTWRRCVGGVLLPRPIPPTSAAEAPSASDPPAADDDWVHTSGVIGEYTSWRRLERADGSFAVYVKTTRCVGETDIWFEVERDGVKTIDLFDPDRDGTAFSADLGLLIVRGYREEAWYDTRTGDRISRPPDHDVGAEITLHRLFEDKGTAGSPLPSGRLAFLRDVLEASRSEAIDGFSDDLRTRLVDEILARDPDPHLHRSDYYGLLRLLGGWSGPPAVAATERVRRRLAGWPDHTLRAPSWIDWREPDRRWSILRLLSIELDGDEVRRGLETLVEAEHLPRVEALTIQGGLDAAGARLLARWTGLGGLDRLELRDCALGDEGAIALAGSPHLGSLRVLEMTDCGLGDTGAIALADHARRHQPARRLLLGRNRVRAAGKEALRAAGYVNRETSEDRPVVLLPDQRR